MEHRNLTTTYNITTQNNNNYVASVYLWTGSTAIARGFCWWKSPSRTRRWLPSSRDISITHCRIQPNSNSHAAFINNQGL